MFVPLPRNRIFIPAIVNVPSEMLLGVKTVARFFAEYIDDGFSFCFMAKKFYRESEIVFYEHPKGTKFIDITGSTFYRLRVLGFAGKGSGKKPLWFCRCECGKITMVAGHSLKSGATLSCGCLQMEKVTINGYSKRGNCSPEYQTWKAMLNRTQNKDCKDYHHYGERGIKVCDRWRESFENFLMDMGERPGNGFSLDRHPDNNGDYCPGNCRWATPKEQANNRRDNRPITHSGKTQNIGQWEKEFGLNKGVLFARLKLGWPIETALILPIRGT